MVSLKPAHKRRKSNFALTVEAQALLTAIAEYEGSNRTVVIEGLIRTKARADLPTETYARAVASAQREE